MKTRFRGRLASAVARAAKLHLLKERLDTASLEDLQAIEKLLVRRSGVGKTGRPEKYSDALLNDVLSQVQEEMLRLRTLRASRSGRKTAIRALVNRVVRQREGDAAIALRAARIISTSAYIFKLYEAARKRGKSS